MEREALIYFRVVRWLVGFMKQATLICGVQGWHAVDASLPVRLFSLSTIQIFQEEKRGIFLRPLTARKVQVFEYRGLFVPWHTELEAREANTTSCWFVFSAWRTELKTLITLILNNTQLRALENLNLTFTITCYLRCKVTCRLSFPGHSNAEK